MLFHTSKIFLIAAALISCQTVGAQDVAYPAPAVGSYNAGCNCGQQGSNYDNCGRGISQQQAMDAWANYCNEQCGFDGQRPERFGGLFGRCGCGQCGGRRCRGGSFGYPGGCGQSACGQRGCQLGGKLHGMFHNQTCGDTCNSCGQNAGSCGCGGRLKGLFQHQNCGDDCGSCGASNNACGCGGGGMLQGLFHRQSCGTGCDSCGSEAASCGCGGKLRGMFGNCNLFHGCGNDCGCDSGCGVKCRLFHKFGGYNQDSCCMQSCVSGCGSPAVEATEAPVAQPVAE